MIGGQRGRGSNGFWCTGPFRTILYKARFLLVRAKTSCKKGTMADNVIFLVQWSRCMQNYEMI